MQTLKSSKGETSKLFQLTSRSTTNGDANGRTNPSSGALLMDGGINPTIVRHGFYHVLTSDHRESRLRMRDTSTRQYHRSQTCKILNIIFSNLFRKYY